MDKRQENGAEKEWPVSETPITQQRWGTRKGVKISELTGAGLSSQ